MKTDLARAFSIVDEKLQALEASLRDGKELPLAETVAESLALVKRVLWAYVQDKVARGERSAPAAPPDEDVLTLFKLFVKGDPSLNAVRDNIRELVYYGNCLVTKREDALPPKPATMAVRTVRHIYLYLYSRALQEHRLETE